MSKRFTARNTLLREVKRTSRGGTCKFTFPLTPKVAKSLGWPELPDGTKGWSPEDSELNATLIELTPNNEELKQHSMTLDASHMGSFAIIRKAKKKGKDSVKASEKITEVLCTVQFSDPEGAGKLERYIQNAARSEMLVCYTPEAVQDELPGTRVDMSPESDQMPLQTAEAAAAVDEVPTEGPAPTHAEKVKQRKEEAERKRKLREESGMSAVQ